MSQPTQSSDLPERITGGQFFATEHRVRTGDIDQEMRVRLDSVARYLQDIANDNLEVTDFRHTDPFWILRRTIIDVIEPITWPATVTMERWCSAMSTRWCNMRVSVRADHQTNMFNPDERRTGVIETEGFWINVTREGTPARISDSAEKMLAATATENRLRWKAINTEPLPDSTELPDRPHVLRSTDFDPFRHLNNAAYFEIVEDELVDHADLVDAPHRAVIEYLRPIAPDAQITVRRRRDGSTLLMWLVVNQQVAATISVRAL